MSVVGFDLGNDTSCVALARRSGIDVLMNKESKRETPSIVNYGDKMRFLGTDAVGKLSLSPQNTVYQLKRLIGKNFDDPVVQADIAKLPFKITKAANGQCAVTLTYCNELATFMPEQLVATVLVDIKRIAEGELGGTVNDCCIAVPAYYTEAERYATLDAAKIAGMSCLRLINENTATALSYGIFKTDLPETDPVHVVFVDVGHSSTQVSVVALKKNGLVVKSHAWDSNLGGRNFDEVLFNHFAAEFKTKTKLDVKSNKKSSFKLRSQCEKTKKMLSANSEAPLNVESIMEEQDMRSMITREDFEALAAPLIQSFTPILQRALEESGVALEDLSSVEVVGGSTRVPSLFAMVEDFFKKTPSRTLNSKECVSRGAALQCAMLSPILKVRDFDVVDVSPYTVACHWEKDGEDASQVLFEKGTPFPSTKLMSLTRAEAFNVAVKYAPESQIGGFSTLIGEVKVGPFTIPAGSEKAKLKVKVSMNLNGLVTVQGIQSCEDEVDGEVVPGGDAKMDDATPVAEEEGVAPMESDGPAAAAAAAADARSKKTKKTVKKTDVPWTVLSQLGYSKKELDEFVESEYKMQASDRLQEETNERKNALEGYVYELRNKMYDVYSKYVSEAERTSLSSTLQAMEDWLYEEGDDVTKSVYVEKLVELKKAGFPVELRYTEDKTRSPAAASLRETVSTYQNIATSEAANFSHIEPADRDIVLRECNSALDWLSEKTALQNSLSKTDTPILLTQDIIKKREVVDRVCRPIATKPIPAPVKKEEPAPAPEAEATPEPMESDKPTVEEPME